MRPFRGTDIDAKQALTASTASKPGNGSADSAALVAREREANKQLLAQSNSKMAKLRQAIVKLKADLIEAETRTAAALSDERAGEDKERIVQEVVLPGEGVNSNAPAG